MPWKAAIVQEFPLNNAIVDCLDISHNERLSSSLEKEKPFKVKKASIALLGEGYGRPCYSHDCLTSSVPETWPQTDRTRPSSIDNCKGVVYCPNKNSIFMSWGFKTPIKHKLPNSY